MFRGVDTHFPLVISITRGEITSADVAAMDAFYAGIHARAGRFLNLVDGRGASRPDSVVRAQIADLTERTLPMTRKYQVANAIVVDSRVAQGVMTALRWMVPAPVQERYSASVAEALAWLEQCAAAENLVISPEARAYLRELELQPTGT